MSEMKLTPEIENALDRVREKIKTKLKQNDSKISVSMHTVAAEEHKEGEVWTDADDRTWTIKNGIKQTVSNLQSAKRPWWCPRCGKAMNHYLDDKMWSKKAMCFDCVVKIEGKIRRAGCWEQYEKNIYFGNQIAFLQDKLQEYEGYISTLSQPTFVLETGELQKWHVDLDTVKKDLQSDIDLITGQIEKLKKEITSEDIFSKYANESTE